LVYVFTRIMIVQVVLFFVLFCISYHLHCLFVFYVLFHFLVTISEQSLFISLHGPVWKSRTRV